MTKPVIKALIEDRGRFRGKRVRLYENGKLLEDHIHFGDLDDIQRYNRGVAAVRGATYVEE